MWTASKDRQNGARFFGAYHFRCRVEHLHLLQDGGAVAGDDDVTFLILDLRDKKEKRQPALGMCVSSLDYRAS